MALTQISTAGVKDDAVTSGKIPANAVGTSEIADNAVTAAKIADNSITAAQLAPDSVSYSELAVNAVGNENINAGAISSGKMASSSVATAAIQDQAVTLAKLPHGDGSSDGKFLRANNGADPTFESVPSPAITGISNATNNRILTSEGGTTVNCESGFTFDGALMKVNTSNNILATFESTDADALIEFKDPNTSDTIVVGCVTGNDLLFRTDAGKMVFSLANNNEKMRLDSSGNLGLGITSTTENTTGDSGPKLITAGDIQIDGDQKALVFRSTGSAAQLQSGIQWWNENGAGVQAKIHCDRTDIVGADSDLVFYTSYNVDTSANNSEGDITEQMRISSRGYVTKPNLPAFRAARQSTDLDVGQGSPIIFNQDGGSYKHFNTGGHYNTSNGRFTAPVAGVYHFHALIIWEQVSNNTNMTDAFDFYINNSQAAYSSRRSFYNDGSTGQGGYFTDHATMTIKLSANDYVWCRNKHASKRIHNNDTYTVFHGHLVG